MFCDTVTVFNFHGPTERWYLSVVYGTDFAQTAGDTYTTAGANNADTVTLLIPCSDDKQITTTAGAKAYVGAKEYAVCGEPNAAITFNPEHDFIYAGAWSDLTPIDDDDYDEGLYQALNSANDGIYRVSSVAFFPLLPHFEIGGR